MENQNYTARKYKSANPLETVNKIRKIFNNINYWPYEVHWTNVNDEIYSMRVESDFKDGNFGTNGKGRTKEFTLASAYAEHIERLQNQLLAGKMQFSRRILNKIKDESGCFYFPDETFIKKDEFYKLPASFLSDILGSSENSKEYIESYYKRIKQNNYDGIVGVPYYDLRNNTIINFPYNIMQILSHSNGMAAGNTPEEAIFQAICEIVERYCAGEVFFKRLTPPTIPDSYLKQFKAEYSLLSKIRQETGFDVIVKDFSANTKLPAVGLLVIDHNKKTYRLNVAGETVFPFALSRCITEIYQGLTNDTIQDMMLPLPEKEYDFFLKDDKEAKMERVDNFMKHCQTASGLFSTTLFESEPSYEFNEEIFNSESDNYKEEITVLKNKIFDYGADIYIRNNSFLGFPTYHVYIPGLSPLGQDSRMLLFSDEMFIKDKYEDMLFPIENLDSKKIENILLMKKDFRKSLHSNVRKGSNVSYLKTILKLEFKHNYYWDSIPVSFFLVLTYIKEGNYRKAHEALEIFIDENNCHEDKYYQAAKLYLEMKIQKYAEDKIKSALQKSNFEDSLISEILNDLNEENVMKGIDIPLCPDCDMCGISGNCLTSNKYRKTITINKEMQKHNINQSDIFKAFDLSEN